MANPDYKQIVLMEFDASGNGIDEESYLTITRLTRPKGGMDFTQKTIRLSPQEQQELYQILSKKFAVTGE